VGARTVAELESGDNDVALGDAAHLRSDLLNDANQLVADRAERVRRLAAVVPEV
jgi:adenylylsulfate kinase-like enzyme